MDHDIFSRIDGSFLGTVEQRWDNRAPSAIGRIAVSGIRKIEENGFVENAQAGGLKSIRQLSFSIYFGRF